MISPASALVRELAGTLPATGSLSQSHFLARAIQDHFFGNPNLGIASLTIDPIKDTPEVLKEYAIQYKITNPNWNLLTGNKETIYKFANNGFNLYVGENPEVGGGFEHSGFFALVDKEGNIRSRFDEQGNPIIYYNGLGDDGVKMLKEDIKLLL